MATQSRIEWTDATWNPVTGCTRVSAGCDHCYAVAMTHRLEGASLGTTKGGATLGRRYAGLTAVNHRGDRHFNGQVRCHEEVLDWPLHRRKPLKIFVNSMSDLFHREVPVEFIAQVFARMAVAGRHTFQILTKRPARMAQYMDLGGYPIRAALDDLVRHAREGKGLKLTQVTAPDSVATRWPLPNVWLGTSIEDQKTAEERIPPLLDCPAAVRFLSVEPLLTPVRIDQIYGGTDSNATYFPLVGKATWKSGHEPWPVLGGPIHWVIVGEETGPRARRADRDWTRAIVEQCKLASVPVFVKQLCEGGRKIPFESWPADLRVREFPR